MNVPTAHFAWRVDTWPDVEGNGPIEPADTVEEGPSNAPQDLLDRLAKQEGMRFRMFDDDNLLYCKGRFLYANEDDIGGEDMFAPLSWYASLGCTRIDYWEKSTETGTYSWQTL